MKMKRLMPLVACLLTACASYAPHPLNDALPDVSLSRDAAALDRPYLRPASIDLAQPLDMNAIATIAVIANPDLKALRARAAVADAQAFAARLLPDPNFSLAANKVLSGPDPFLDLAGALGLDINALRTAKVRRMGAEALARQVRLDLAWAEWQTAGQARLQAARIISLAQLVPVLAASNATARALLERTLRAAGRGDLAADQAQAARIAAFDAQDRMRSAERDLAAARLELTRLLGLPPATSLALAPQTPDETQLDPEHLFAIAKSRRFDLQALQAGYGAQEAVLHKAILDQFPNLMLTINSGRDSAGNTSVGPAVSFDLPIWNRNRGVIAAERATREALRAEYDARLFQTRAEIAAAISGLTVARKQRRAVTADLPALTRFAVAARRAATRGDLPLGTAETAEQTVRDKQVLLAQSDQAIAEQMIALELLTGTLNETWTR
ncbi:MAG: TolC family protein [Novosphingobium sp.]|uniref:TolC family protein n=1 Tax=Novosphingobium sp. TaxID=1874826 RepID=UPI003015E792